MPLEKGSPVTLPQNQDVHLSAHPARPLRFLGRCSIRKRSRVESMVTGSTEDERLSVASCHHLLPQCFSFGDIFHFPYVMDLKRAVLRLTIFALAGIQSFNQLRTAERESECIGRDVDPWVV